MYKISRLCHYIWRTLQKKTRIYLALITGLFVLRAIISTLKSESIKEEPNWTNLESDNSPVFGSSRDLIDRSSSKLYLDLGGQDWTVKNDNSSIVCGASVPGGIYTDLQSAGKFSGPLYWRFNDIDLAWVGMENWIYEKTFWVPAEFQDVEEVVIHLEGVDSVADVILNNKLVGSTDNMFVRYVTKSNNLVSLDTLLYWH